MVWSKLFRAAVLFGRNKCCVAIGLALSISRDCASPRVQSHWGPRLRYLVTSQAFWNSTRWILQATKRWVCSLFLCQDALTRRIFHWAAGPAGITLTDCKTRSHSKLRGRLCQQGWEPFHHVATRTHDCQTTSFQWRHGLQQNRSAKRFLETSAGQRALIQLWHTFSILPC